MCVTTLDSPRAGGENDAVAASARRRCEALTESTGDGYTIHGDFLVAEAIEVDGGIPEVPRGTGGI